ncbi:MAG TPA: FAD-dependent oxidoreductase [Candidatus Paceibacterota bacterium]|nr:FAD-dependent oxidoreductase [Verrucomicrobiota bacterium]HRZ45010.1 FAD-dependent oxidoreductase [Candidatus Paceibacterota bacterium]
MNPAQYLNRRAFLKSTVAVPALGAYGYFARSQATGPSRKDGGGGRELRSDVVVIGGGFGGIAAALAAARRGRTVIVTEETAWIGGQATTQCVPLDEHPWIEQYGRTQSYADFRKGVRDYYRRHYPLTLAARADRSLNPGAGWVSALCFEPRVGIAVLEAMLASHRSAGRILILPRHCPTQVLTDGDCVRAVTVHDNTTGVERVLTAPYFLDATELGELIEMGSIEHVVGAESQAETGEPNALEGPADPMDQMGFTHVFAMDYLPGEDHTIERPRDYARWRNPSAGSASRSPLTVADLFGHERDYFGRPVRAGAYVSAPWSFRRLLCRCNFAPGAFPSDVTSVIWGQNEYRAGVLCGVSAETRRRHMEAARHLSLSLMYWMQTEMPDPATGALGLRGLRPRGDVLGTADGLAQYPYIRESCRIRAEYVVRETDFRNDIPARREGPVKYKDSVGVGGYRIDIHKPARASRGSLTDSNHGKHWRQQIPLGAFIPVRIENLLPACKNLGVTSVVNGAFRLHPVEWNVGEVAGSLAAFCLERCLAPRQVRNTAAHLADFQRELVRQGVELDWPGIETARSYYSHHNLELRDIDTFYFGEADRL